MVNDTPGLEVQIIVSPKCQFFRDGEGDVTVANHISRAEFQQFDGTKMGIGYKALDRKMTTERITL